jgi:hypothetical protein
MLREHQLQHYLTGIGENGIGLLGNKFQIPGRASASGFDVSGNCLKINGSAGHFIYRPTPKIRADSSRIALKSDVNLRNNSLTTAAHAAEMPKPFTVIIPSCW